MYLETSPEYVVSSTFKQRPNLVTTCTGIIQCPNLNNPILALNDPCAMITVLLDTPWKNEGMDTLGPNFKEKHHL